LRAASSAPTPTTLLWVWLALAIGLPHLRCCTARTRARLALRVPLIARLWHALVIRALAACSARPFLAAALTPVVDVAAGVAERCLSDRSKQMLLLKPSHYLRPQLALGRHVGGRPGEPGLRHRFRLHCESMLFPSAINARGKTCEYLDHIAERGKTRSNLHLPSAAISRRSFHPDSHPLKRSTGRASTLCAAPAG
jgi:hypothetical protein